MLPPQDGWGSPRAANAPRGGSLTPLVKVRCAACGRPIGRRRRPVFLHSPEPLEPEVFGPFHSACVKKLRDETFPGWDISDLETGEVLK